MRFRSVCSGIEAASVAWHPLGWTASFLSEIEAFPRAVLAHHYPETPLHGDFTTIRAGEYDPIDLLVGGTPCQSFSVAGLRGGLDDDRGNLALEYLRLADRLRPRWLVWENVPGVLSSNGGRDFGSILGGMGELGYGVAYRVLDAQFFDVAQRRRRVFVVGHLGDWRRAAAVLFERHSLSGNPAPRREAGESAAGTFKACAGSGGWSNSADHAAAGYMIPVDSYVPPIVPQAMSSKWAKGSSGPSGPSGDEVANLVAVKPAFAIQERAVCENLDAGPGGAGFRSDDAAYTIEARTVPQAVAYRVAGDGAAYHEGDATAPLTTGTDSSASIVAFDTTQITSAANYSNPQPGDPCHPLASGDHAPAVAFAPRGREGGAMPEIEGDGVRIGALRAASGGSSRDYVAFQPGNLRRGAGSPPSEAVFPTLKSDHGRGLSDQHPHIAAASAVRRLTPRECERLQGFPDDYTLIPHRGKPAADGPRYKALGNSMAVPVMRWIGERIQAVEAIPQAQDIAA